jgi:hypothetical protein
MEQYSHFQAFNFPGKYQRSVREENSYHNGKRSDMQIKINDSISESNQKAM